MLSLLVFLPLVGALVLALAPVTKVEHLRAVAVTVTSFVGFLSVLLFFQFDGAVAAAQSVESYDWFRIGAIQVSYDLGVDGISILLVALTGILMPFVALSSFGHVNERVKEFLVWLLVMETGMMGVFLSLDMVLFYFFWEISLVPLYFILGIWGGEKRIYATIKFFLFTLAGSLVMLVAVIWLIYASGYTSLPDLVTWVARQRELAAAGEAHVLTASLQTGLFAAFALAFAIKVPLFPFHTWLADAHTQAPTAGSVILAGVLLKMGTYGLLRFGIGLFPEAALAAAPLFMALGAFGIVYGALLAMAQTDVKRLIACSSVSHLGFVVLGMFALTSAGLRGSVLQMINHGLSTGLLFLLFGAIYERTHSRKIESYGGIAACVPIFAFFWVFSMLSSVGLPGLNGFVGEWLILYGSFQANPWITAVAVTGVIFGAVYLLMVTRKMLFGPVRHEESRALRDLGGREVAILAPLCALCLWIGVAPATCIDKTAGTLDALVDTLDSVREPLRTGQAPGRDATPEESAR